MFECFPITYAWGRRSTSRVRVRLNMYISWLPATFLALLTFSERAVAGLAGFSAVVVLCQAGFSLLAGGVYACIGISCWR